MNSLRTSGRLLEIDSLRVIGCLIVFFLHAIRFVKDTAGTDPLAKLIFDKLWYANFGLAAVLIFFAISGYVITGTIKGPVTKASFRFVLGRFFRLYPVFWLSVIVSCFVLIQMGEEHKPGRLKCI